MKKIFNILCIAFVFVTMLIVPTYVNAEDKVPDSITLTTNEVFKGYIGDNLNFGTKTMNDGTYVYCLDYNKKTTINTVAKNPKEMDAGMVYLMENGFPNKKFTGNDRVDYYITQVAVYWYLDETTGSKNLPDGFTTTDKDSINARSTIKRLVDGAVAAKNKGEVNPSITLSTDNSELSMNNDSTYFVSNTINVNSTDKYTASLDGAPEGSYIADLNGNKKDTFDANEGFKVYVPVDKENGQDASFTVNVKLSSVTYKVYSFTPDDSREQPLVTPVLYPVQKDASNSMALSFKYPTVPVPDTRVNNIIFYIIGALLTISGVVLTAHYAKNK